MGPTLKKKLQKALFRRKREQRIRRYVQAYRRAQLFGPLTAEHVVSIKRRHGLNQADIRFLALRRGRSLRF